MQNRDVKFLIAAAATAMMASAAAAQTTTVFDTDGAASDAIETLDEDIKDDFESNATAFGNSGRDLGWYGSVSGRATATGGNTDTVDVGIGSRFGYFDGLNGHDVTLSYTYGEDDGTVSSDSLLLGYDYTRTLSAGLYAFGMVQHSSDQFASYAQDTFVGAGLGYRVFDSGNTKWSVQAGPGFRALEDQAGLRTEESALSVSSNYYHMLSEAVFVTNDTDIIGSESDTAVSNELGLNVAMTNTLALRTSLLTEYHTDPLAGFDKTDNTVGVSVVYTFN